MITAVYIMIGHNCFDEEEEEEEEKETEDEDYNDDEETDHKKFLRKAFCSLYWCNIHRILFEN